MVVVLSDIFCFSIINMPVRVDDRRGESMASVVSMDYPSHSFKITEQLSLIASFVTVAILSALMEFSFRIFGAPTSSGQALTWA